MKYKILNEEYDKPLLDRLFKIRWIESEQEKKDFLNPSFKNFWHDFNLLSDMEKSVNRVMEAIEKDQRIVIFGDYDVDWVSATYLLFYFFYKILQYKHVSFRLPSRADGYGIRNKHLDELKTKWVELVITVDNWVTAIWEMEYAKEIGLDVIVTDHHSPLETLPKAFSIVNPKTSPDYPFLDLAWVWVAFKFVSAIASKINLDNQTKERIMNLFLPIVALWTVTDCVKLVDENRLLLKKWLEIINNPQRVPDNIKHFMSFLNIKKMDSYHIWFVVWPRLNASWRVHKPDDSFQVLFQHNKKVQSKYIEKLEEMNTQRRQKQSDIYKDSEKLVDLSKNILIASWEFHEWVIWIVAWKLTEKYNKPSIIMHIDKKKKLAVASCRAPSYFNIVNMLEEIWWDWLLDRFGGHAQAWWLTCKLKNLDKFKELAYKYTESISPKDLEKTLMLDSKITEKDLLDTDLSDILSLAPFWEWNREPVFLIEDVKISKIDFVWKNKKHLKIHGKCWSVDISLIRWSGASMLDKISNKERVSFVVTLEEDTYRKGFYFKIKEILDL